MRVAVVEEHEILRRGLVASLSEDGNMTVTTAELGVPVGDEVDVAVVSSEAVRRTRYACPVIVFIEDHEVLADLDGGNNIAGILPAPTLTAAQLRATVHAAATGLRIDAGTTNGSAPMIDPRARRVLELMADGCATREIAEQMSYSERTIKKLITGLQAQLGARSRAHIVAQAIRRGLV